MRTRKRSSEFSPAQKALGSHVLLQTDDEITIKVSRRETSGKRPFSLGDSTSEVFRSP
jgi:hypothetical protein